MRLTFEGSTIEAIFDQMALTLGERIQEAPGRNSEIDARDRAITAQRTTIKAKDLRIAELEQHLAHAVGTKDLQAAVTRATGAFGDTKVTKALDAATDALTGYPKEVARRYVEEPFDDVDRAIKVRHDFDGTLVPGVWRLTILQYKLWRSAQALYEGWAFPEEMPNGEWIIRVEEKDGNE